MLLGPDNVIACPHCGARAKYRSLNSGNTIGATVWSDGRMFAPMLPRPPLFVKCKICNNVHRLKDAELTGESSPGELKRWKREELPYVREDLPYVEEAEAEDYYLAIEQGMANDVERGQFLRILAWWKDNDRYRDRLHRIRLNDAHSDEASQRRRDNMQALAEMLDENADENDRLMKCELLRELGLFEQAKALLSVEVSDDATKVVELFRSLCENRDSSLHVIR